MTSFSILAAAMGEPVHPLLIIPFGVLLLLIAVMPLTGPKGRHFWEKYHPAVAGVFALFMAGWYLVKRSHGLEAVSHTFQEYVSFICLIGSLFIVAGGIHVRERGHSTPSGNLVFLLIGAVIANLVGTTGAAMLLIRPWLRMNAWRARGFHTVFFIFVVANVGGCLTPIGDPPLFLGYLHGIPFFWLTGRALLPWAFTVGLILAVFYLLDRKSFHHASKKLQKQAERRNSWQFEGVRNVALIGVIVGAVFLPERWFIRELVMIAAAVTSYFITPAQVHEANEFTFAPIREVAALFIGIFMTMMPALNYLEQHGADLGFSKPMQFYFSTGSLSAVLDNAPTYLNFLKLAEVTTAASPSADYSASASTEGNQTHEWREERSARIERMLAEAPRLILAVSLGAVFFGAMTYIGNGPNFMVKSIAEAAGVEVPSFFGYVLRYSLPMLLPILAVSGIVFLAL